MLRRSTLLWFLGRLTLAALLLIGEGNPVVLHPKASLLLVIAVGVLSSLDTRRRNEDLLLANLGTSRSTIYLLGFGPPLALEFLVAVIGRL